MSKYGAFAALLGFIGIVAVSLFFSFYALSESPGLWYDEGYYLQLAINQERYGELFLQVSPTEYLSASVVTGGFPLIYPMAASFAVFGPGVLEARWIMALYTVGLVVVSLFFIRALFGVRSALLAGILLATLPLLYGNGKAVLGEVPGLFYFVSFLWGIYWLSVHDYRGVVRYALVAALAGLAVATKPTFLLLLPAVLVGLVLHRQSITFRVKEIAVAFLVFSAICVVWMFTQFSNTDSWSHILSYYSNPYDVHFVSAILQNAARFLSEGTPLYLLGCMGIWGLGIAARLVQRQRITLSETIALGFSLLVIAAYLRTAGWYRYFFPALILALLFVPPALQAISEFTQRYIPGTYQKKILLLFVLLLAGFQMYQLLFSSYVADYYSGTRTRDLAAYFEALPPDKSVFLYDAPEIVIFLKTDQYYQYLEPLATRPLGVNQLQILQSGGTDIALIETSKFERVKDRFAAYGAATQVNRYTILIRQ